jgi:hypothetical protein
MRYCAATKFGEHTITGGRKIELPETPPYIEHLDKITKEKDCSAA